MQLEDCYRLLELAPEASLAEVEESYRRLSKVWDPGRFDDQQTRTFADNRQRQLTDAYSLVRYELRARHGVATSAAPGQRTAEDVTSSPRVRAWPGEACARRKAEPTAPGPRIASRPTRWLNFYALVHLPVGGVLGIGAALISAPRLGPTITGTQVLWCVGGVTLGLGLARRKLWAWYVNFAFLGLSTIFFAIVAGLNRPADFLTAFFVYALGWFVPNTVYFNRRKSMFVRAARGDQGEASERGAEDLPVSAGDSVSDPQRLTQEGAKEWLFRIRVLYPKSGVGLAGVALVAGVLLAFWARPFLGRLASSHPAPARRAGDVAASPSLSSVRWLLDSEFFWKQPRSERESELLVALALVDAEFRRLSPEEQTLAVRRILQDCALERLRRAVEQSQ